ncbi:hypothetical protein HDU87_008822 [Geranomyces variabilis]|uniref:Uncharacterized protein n=1 Tax=Geranomyces variabilis TaxID=109894 RepID=A0AAD5XMF9_9FUNG|nr:hypothetical protein HDU87_008822 [Geranomyces variabilis]
MQKPKYGRHELFFNASPYMDYPISQAVLPAAPAAPAAPVLSTRVTDIVAVSLCSSSFFEWFMELLYRE